MPTDVGFAAQPIIPVIDLEMKAHLRAVLVEGAQRGNRPDAFAKVGDSITALPSFLTGLGVPAYDPASPLFAGSHTDLASTIQYFRSRVVDGLGQNSFTHVSWAATGGWRTDDVMNRGHNWDPRRSPPCARNETPLACELRLTRPSIALIMIGTIDQSDINDPELFRFNLTYIANTVLSFGVIPILSTIPDEPLGGPARSTRVPQYNQVVSDVAAALDIPLWNYWAALQPLPDHGISADGVHPNSYPLGADLFIDEGLLFGFNVRNLTAVEVLDKLKRIVLDDGQPDCPSGELSPSTAQYVTALYKSVLGRPPEPAGLNSWGQRLQCGLPPMEAAREVWQSAEHRGLQVDQYYASFLHRHPDAGERDGWVQVLLTGASEQDVQQAFLLSSEYQATHRDDVSFVGGLYQDVLGRAPDAEGQAAWQQKLREGQSPQRVVQAFLASAETAQNAVDGFYQSFLGRTADTAGEQAWVGALLQGRLSLEAVAEAILSSSEFRARSN